jgi:hypothetical protein
VEDISVAPGGPIEVPVVDAYIHHKWVMSQYFENVFCPKMSLLKVRDIIHNDRSSQAMAKMRASAVVPEKEQWAHEVKP